MRELKLENSNTPALINDEDFDRVSKFKWYEGTRQIHRTEDKLNFSLACEVMFQYTLMFDHKDTDWRNNQKSNLRACTNQQNSFNKNKIKYTSSQYKGVIRTKGKWRARIEINDKKQHLGYFLDEADAARAYDKRALELFGEFARINFPQK